jgi:hypothetical protein
MMLYHTIPKTYYDQKRAEDPEIWHLQHMIPEKYRLKDTKLAQRSQAIWCCDHPSSNNVVGNHKTQPRVVLEIDCTGLTIENHQDFHIRGIDYYLVLASQIPWNRTRVLFTITPTQRKKSGTRKKSSAKSPEVDAFQRCATINDNKRTNK